jgi:hypothetical protein
LPILPAAIAPLLLHLSSLSLLVRLLIAITSLLLVRVTGTAPIGTSSTRISAATILAHALLLLLLRSIYARLHHAPRLLSLLSLLWLLLLLPLRQPGLRCRRGLRSSPLLPSLRLLLLAIAGGGLLAAVSSLLAVHLLAVSLLLPISSLLAI